jgi:hypothetical protein
LPTIPTATNCDPDQTTPYSSLASVIRAVHEVTVSVVEPETAHKLAVIVVVPLLSEVDIPLEPGALLIVAIPVLDELHDTNFVTSSEVPFEYVPVAVNCWGAPMAVTGFTGLTAIDTIGMTVSFVESTISPEVALIVVMPLEKKVISPLESNALLTVATDASEELQVNEDVIYRLIASEYNPTGLSCFAVPQ